MTSIVSETVNSNDENINFIHQRENHHHQFFRIFPSRKILFWMISFICLIIIAGPFSCYLALSLPDIKSRNSPLDIFSEERAFDYLLNLTQYGSRVGNTRGNFHARDYLLSQLKRMISKNKRNLRFDIDLQNFTNSHQVQLQNILIRVSNQNITSRKLPNLMLSAHYDSVELSSGASDDGTGVVIILELLSNLINDQRINFSKMSLIVIFTNGEEMGLLGSQAFISNHSWSTNIYRFINVDSGICNEKAVLIRMKPTQLIYDYNQVKRPFTNIFFENILKWNQYRSDYDVYSSNTSLYGYDFGCIFDSYLYHTNRDQPISIKRGIIQNLGDNLSILIRYIFSSNLNEQLENQNDNDSLIYFDLFGQYMIIYKLSTSIFIQKILIIVLIILSSFLLLFDKIFHKIRSLNCLECSCIYFYFQYASLLRLISILIYFLFNILSLIVGLLLSLLTAGIISLIRPLSWFGSPLLAICLFGFPCLIGIYFITYVSNIIHNRIRKKWPKKSSLEENQYFHIEKLNFDFEQNLSIILVYSILMYGSIIFSHRLTYLILVWSIFICPIYLCHMIIQIMYHYNMSKSWLYLPLIVSLFPLSHTSDIMFRLIRIFIPFLVQKFSFGWSSYGNSVISSLVTLPLMIFILLFIPIIHRFKHFCRILFILLTIFFITLLVAYFRQPFDQLHPHMYHVSYKSESFFNIKQFSNISFSLNSSSIRILSLYDSSLQPILEEFSSKTGHVLQNKYCFQSIQCQFDDPFNRTLAIRNIQIQSLNSSNNYRIIIHHVLSSSINISSSDSIQFIIHNQIDILRSKTIIDLFLDQFQLPFSIHISIRSCNMNDSLFLILLNRFIRNAVQHGSGRCRLFEDSSILMFN